MYYKLFCRPKINIQFDLSKFRYPDYCELNNFNGLDLTRIPRDANVLAALFTPTAEDPLFDRAGNLTEYFSLDAKNVSVRMSCISLVPRPIFPF